VTVSAKIHIVPTTLKYVFLKFSALSALSTVFKEYVLKFQLNQASSFEVKALDSRESKKINLYSKHTKINYRHLHLQP